VRALDADLVELGILDGQVVVAIDAETLDLVFALDQLAGLGVDELALDAVAGVSVERVEGDARGRARCGAPRLSLLHPRRLVPVVCRIRRLAQTS